MDFNDLNTKLKRLYAALGERYHEDVVGSIVDECIELEGGVWEHRTTFGTNDVETNLNLIMAPIHAIGSLKDIIKKKLQIAGQSPRLYEDLINQNTALALATDLDNKDKHGDPLTQARRSARDPQISNVQQGLRGRGITSASFTTDFNTGKTTLNAVEGDVKISVVADVVDSDGQLIMALDKMLEDSLNAIETFVKRHGLI